MSEKKDSILNIYDENVEHYSSTRGQSLFEKKYLDQVIAELKPNSSILDLGCGIGQPIAAYFSSQGFNITGVDGSPNMIQKAGSLQPNSTWLVADMRTLHLNKKFEALIAWDSFFHLTQDEQRNMFAIFTEHLKPNGILMFTSGPDAGIALGEMNGRELYHSSLSTSEYNQILIAHGFTVIEHKLEDPDCGGHTVWIARYN